MTNLTRKQVELIVRAQKHAKQGIADPRYAKDQCYEIVIALEEVLNSQTYDVEVIK